MLQQTSFRRGRGCARRTPQVGRWSPWFQSYMEDAPYCHGVCWCCTTPLPGTQRRALPKADRCVCKCVCVCVCVCACVCGCMMCGCMSVCKVICDVYLQFTCTVVSCMHCCMFAKQRKCVSLYVQKLLPCQVSCQVNRAISCHQLSSCKVRKTANRESAYQSNNELISLRLIFTLLIISKLILICRELLTTPSTKLCYHEPLPHH